MPLDKGYSEDKKRISIDPTITPGSNLDPMDDEKMMRLKDKFFPKL